MKNPKTDVALRVEAVRLPAKIANARHLSSARFLHATKRTAETLASKVGHDVSKKREDAIATVRQDPSNPVVCNGNDILVDSLAAIDAPKISSYNFLKSEQQSPAAAAKKPPLQDAPKASEAPPFVTSADLFKFKFKSKFFLKYFLTFFFLKNSFTGHVLRLHHPTTTGNPRGPWVPRRRRRGIS